MPPRVDMPSGPEIPKVYRAEGRRLRQSTATEESLRAIAEASRKQLEAVASKPEDDPERIQAEFDFEEHNLDLETFDLTHDPTGALKRDAIGGDLAEQLRERIAKSEQEPATIDTPEKITPVFLVNMGELDRLNKVNPNFGNDALTKLAGIISDKLEAQLGVAEGGTDGFCKIYRADNNSFMVRFTREIPKAAAIALRDSFSGEQNDIWAGEKMFEERGQEVPPVIADFVSIEEVLHGMPPALRASGKEETYAVGALKDVLFSMQDARKIVSRVDRVRALAKQDDAKARDLYDKFLKKSIAGVFISETGPNAVQVPVETYEQFKTYFDQLEQDPHAKTAIWETAFAKVLGDLRIRYEKDKRYSKQLEGFVAQKAKAEYQIDVEARRSSMPPGAELPKDREGLNFQLPDRNTATEGLREFARLRDEAGALKDNLDKAKAQNASPQEMKWLEQITRIQEKKLARERSLRDQATGLELRGPMFKKTEAGLEAGKRVANVSLDMGFLKYFDQVGGRETGDLAILKAAEMFQKIKDEFSKDGVEVSVHRLGGDEFGMTVIGEASIDAATFTKRLGELRKAFDQAIEDAGPIPAQQGAKPGYYATKLNLGVGVHFYEDGKAAEAEDARYELTKQVPEGKEPGTPEHSAWVRQQRADHLVKVADKLMEYHKASNRFRTLLEQMEEMKGLTEENDINREEERLKQLLAFSDKAISGKLGRNKLEEWRDRLEAGATPEDLDAEVHEFVWEMMEKNAEKAAEESTVLENYVEYAVRIEYLKDRIDQLEKKLDEVTSTEDSKQERYTHEVQKLKTKLSSAEEDLSKVKALKAAMSKS